MRSGLLDKRVRLEQKGGGTDAIGQPLDGWTLLDEVWASIKHPSGLSSIKSGADVSIVKASIRIRYRADVNAGMRVVHGFAIYDIQAALPNQREGYVDLVCELVQ